MNALQKLRMESEPGRKLDKKNKRKEFYTEVSHIILAILFTFFLYFILNSLTSGEWSRGDYFQY